jgi:RHS repeat-associated protein
VITQQDDAQNPVEPSLAQTFSLYGITAFDVQYWTGSAWTTVPGGSVTGNNKVWRQFNFSPVTTNKIRVVVNAGADNAFSRLVEVEAWGHVSTETSSNIHWLVTDHLGTPRMIIDQTGTVANVKRHDYLPFGEELFAPAGGRTTALGYAAGDGIRQQFTAKERDVETGLDCFLARYYSSTQGRFTSADELVSATNPIAYADMNNPQSLNRYHYLDNNPLITTDPDGHCPKNRPCPTTSIQPTGLPETKLQETVGAGTVDVAISAGKVLGNIGIGINNFSNFYLNGNDPANVIEPFESSSKAQDVAMHAFEVLTVVSPALGEFGPATVLTASSRQAAVAAAETENTLERASTLKPGPFATESIPARGPQRSFRVGERNTINEIGLRSGCQTCGTTNPGTRSGNFIPDHQPPNALNLTNGLQRLFPHCNTCSHRQAGEVAAFRKFNPDGYKF